MRIVDCFVHPINCAKEETLFDVQKYGLLSAARGIRKTTVRAGVDHAVLTLFSRYDELAITQDAYPEFSVCMLAYFSDQSWLDNLEVFARQGLRGIIFHPYLQKITREKWVEAVRAARLAETLGLYICVCTAYGTKSLYDIAVLPFANLIAESVNSPVVFSHAGGSKVLEALLIADNYPNVFIDTSYSLSYWLGSSIENDLAFAVRKLGVERWLYGSDSPFVLMEDALSDHLEFFKRHKFRDFEIEKIMGANAVTLLKI